MSGLYKILFIVFTEILRVLVTSRFADLFLERPDKQYKRFIAYIVSVCITSLEYYFFNITWLNLLSTLLGLFIIAFPYVGKIKKKIQFVLYVLAISCVLDIGAYVLLSSTLDYENYSESASILSLFFLLVVQLIARRVLIKNKDEELSDAHWWQYIITLVICIAASLIVIMDHSLSQLSLSVVAGSFLIINLIIGYLFEDLIKTKQNEYENLMLKEQARAYEKELLMQQENSDAMKAFRHDIKHHLTQMAALNEEGKTEQLDKYIHEFADSLEEIVPISFTGNIGVDGVLNFMLQKAKDKGIKVNSRIVIPEELEISVFDMNIILGNLLENAIEANEGVMEPRIDFLMKYAKESLFLEISNTHANSIVMNKNEMVSSKSNKNMHGYGVRNVKKVLTKYEHTIDFEDTGDVFTVHIMMKL